MPSSPVPQFYSEAFQCHQRGQLGAAEALYRRVLAAEPAHAGALHGLGLLAYQHGRFVLAAELIRRVVTIEPNAFAAHSDLGEALRALGQIDEALAGYRRALELNPTFVPAWYNLGNALLQRGQTAEAVTAYQRAVQLQPGLAEAWNNLGTALRQQQRVDEAIVVWRTAVELRADYIEALTNLSAALGQQGNFAEALAASRRVLELRPDYAQAHLNLGNLRWAQGQQAEAIEAWRRALAFQPDFAEAHYNLGNAFKEQGEFADAIAAYDEALRCKAGFVEACNNRGDALMELGRFAEAEAAWRRALEMDAGHVSARYNLGVLALLRGDYLAAWPSFEARGEAFHLVPPGFAQPRWDGQPLTGQRVLLHAEQGLGDSIHFIRYAPLVAERGGEVTVRCQRPLVELFRSVKGVRVVLADRDALPPFDLHLPMLSLPLAFQTTTETIPRDVPYLFADPARREIWQKRLGDKQSRLRVGLAWAGNPRNVPLRKRDIPLEMLAPLVDVQGVEFFSLQVEQGAEQLRQCPWASAVIDHTAHIRDFADTAALMMEMDLVITIDTAVAHLAGALGRPVWTLLAFVADWRWAQAGECAPWYPTMRLFRQPALRDWNTVIKRVASELTRDVARRVWRKSSPSAAF